MTAEAYAGIAETFPLGKVGVERKATETGEWRDGRRKPAGGAIQPALLQVAFALGTGKGTPSRHLRPSRSAWVSTRANRAAPSPPSRIGEPSAHALTFCALESCRGSLRDNRSLEAAVR